MVALYFAAFAFSVLLLILTLAATSQYRGNYHILSTMTTAIVNFGYWQLAMSHNLEEALLANRIAYLDGTFLTLFIFLAVAQFCRIRVPTWMITAMSVAGFVVLGLSYTGGYSTIYYSNVSIIRRHGVTFLVTQDGPAHILYTCLIVVYVVIDLGVMVYAFRNKNKVSYINTFFLLATELFCMAVYAIESLTACEIQLLPFAYVLNMALLFVLFHRTNLYDLSINAEHIREERREYGYVSFSRHGKYIGSNDVARKYFPELEHLLMDHRIPPKEEFLYKEFGDWVTHLDSNTGKTRYYTRNDRILKCRLSYFTMGKQSHIQGYLIEISDDTNQQLHIQELNEMARKAEEANLAKSTFIANMSHEIRTPIHAVLGMNEMIMRESSEPQIRVYAGNIKKSGNLLLSLVNNILDYSRMEQGNQKLQPVTYETGKLLSNALDVIRLQTNNKNLRLEVFIDEHLPVKLIGDDLKFQQILFNLLTNAVKYTNEGYVRLCVSQKERHEDSVSIGVSVEDSGIGIRKEDIAHLTNAFCRVDEKRNRNIEGAGLGLSIASQLLQQMGSQLIIDSEYGVGSIFSFELIQQIADASELGPFSSFSEEDSETPVPVTPRFTAPEAKILVVDDNEMNRFVFRGLLKYLKVQVTFAESGKECLSAIATRHFDLIFMDHLMPELDGIETLHIMKKRSGHLCTDSKIIAVTANAYPDARDVYLKEGFDDFLEKPVEGKQLESIIYQYLPKSLIRFTDNNSEEHTRLSDKASLGSISAAGDMFLKEQLSHVGIDVSKGLSYAGDDWSFYLEVLKCFTDEYKDKRELLLTRKKNLSEDSHFDAFTNLTHQLKGEARGIGHMELGEKFYQLETASRAHRKDTITTLFQDTLDLWEHVVTSLKTCLP
ncbi:MAG: ATP-binding protein [Lachnospiraceae bacterium]|nr:ATP-binding protein [Lachnospiraceae bacterium]